MTCNVSLELDLNLIENGDKDNNNSNNKANITPLFVSVLAKLKRPNSNKTKNVFNEGAPN